MVPLVSVPFRGRAQGRRNATRTQGGVWHTTRPFSLSPFWFFRPRPDDTRRGQRGVTGRERPPIFDRWRGQPMGWVWHQVWHTPPRRGGSLPVRMYPCGKAPRPARGPDDQPHRSARCVTHSSAPSWSSAASVPRAPGRGRACSPRPTPWPCSSATTRRTCTRRSSPGRRRARRGRVPHGPISHQPVADLVRPDGRQFWAPVPPSPRGRFRLRRTARRSSSGRSIPRVRAIEIPAPEWLTIPERGLSPGVAIFGTVGSGKTSACLHSFARQLLSWHADNPAQRPAALVLEVKGDSCHDIRRMLTELDRGGDYLELSSMAG